MTAFQTSLVFNVTVNVPDEMQAKWTHGIQHNVAENIKSLLAIKLQEIQSGGVFNHAGQYRPFDKDTDDTNMVATLVSLNTADVYTTEVPSGIRRRNNLMWSMFKSFGEFFQQWNSEGRHMYVDYATNDEIRNAVKDNKYLIMKSERMTSWRKGATFTFPEIDNDESKRIVWEKFIAAYNEKLNDLYMQTMREAIMTYLAGVYDDGGMQELRESVINTDFEFAMKQVAPATADLF